MAITRTTSRADARCVGRSGREAALASASRNSERASACVRAGVVLALATGAALAGAQGLPSPAYPSGPAPAATVPALPAYPGAPVPAEPGAETPGERGRATGSGFVWLLEPSVDALFTLTDNVNLTTTDRKADFVTQLTPGLRFSEQSAHTRLQGNVQVPVLLYARTGSQNDDVEPQVALSGIAELVERLFFVEAAVNVSQQYLSPFGPTPVDLSTATNNRYTAQSYRVSPILRGDAGNGLTYQLRDDNIWSNESNTTFVTQSAYTNELNGKLTQEPRPLGWQLEYDLSETHFVDQAPQRSQIARAHMLARPDPTFEWSLDAGYENNNFPGVNESGAVYGGGVRWRPTDRTTVDATLEHRFFGGSYHVTIDHRTPLSIWSIRASRDITTYPQQLAAFAAGEDVNALLNRLFSSRFTDPLQRQQFVDQFIRERGLPATVGGPLSLYTQEVLLQESFEARAGLIGARNSILASVFRLRTEPVGDVGTLLPALLAQDNNTQTGGTVTWTLKVTPLYTLATSGTYTRTVENVGDGQLTRQFALTSSLAAPLSPLTRGFVGVRWQRLLSNFGNDYRETAVFVGINHIFR